MPGGHAWGGRAQVHRYDPSDTSLSRKYSTTWSFVHCRRSTVSRSPDMLWLISNFGQERHLCRISTLDRDA